MGNFREMASSFFRREAAEISEKDGVIKKLEKQLAIIEEYTPYLPKEHQEKPIELERLEFDKDGMMEAAAAFALSEDQAKRIKAYDQIRSALSKITSELNTAITEHIGPWATIQQVYSELRDQSKSAKFTEAPALIRKAIEQIRAARRPNGWEQKN